MKKLSRSCPLSEAPELMATVSRFVKGDDEDEIGVLVEEGAFLVVEVEGDEEFEGGDVLARFGDDDA